MPGADELPEELRPFAFRNALVLDTGVDFHHHADRLIAGIHEIVHGRPISKRKTGWMLPATIIVAASLIAAAIWWAVSRSKFESVPTVPTTPAPRATETAVPSPAAIAATTTPPAISAPAKTGAAPTVAPTIEATVPNPSLSAAPTAPRAALPETVRDSTALLPFTPPNFTRIAPRVSSSPRTIINDRFRSADGTVEFALTAVKVGDLAPTVDARRIAIPRLEGETFTERTPTKDSSIFHEDATVAGPRHSYTRYFAVDVPWSSTSGVAAARLWEFWVRDEEALRKYKEVYRDFKSRTKFP
jgi:hypothetical protein